MIKLEELNTEVIDASEQNLSLYLARDGQIHLPVKLLKIIPSIGHVTTCADTLVIENVKGEKEIIYPCDLTEKSQKLLSSSISDYRLPMRTFHPFIIAPEPPALGNVATNKVHIVTQIDEYSGVHVLTKDGEEILYSCCLERQFMRVLRALIEVYDRDCKFYESQT